MTRRRNSTRKLLLGPPNKVTKSKGSSGASMKKAAGASKITSTAEKVPPAILPHAVSPPQATISISAMQDRMRNANPSIDEEAIRAAIFDRLREHPSTTAADDDTSLPHVTETAPDRVAVEAPRPPRQRHLQAPLERHQPHPRQMAHKTSFQHAEEEEEKEEEEPQGFATREDAFAHANPVHDTARLKRGVNRMISREGLNGATSVATPVAAPNNIATPTNGASRTACVPCRKDRKKCTRETPECSRCAKEGWKCEYGGTVEENRARKHSDLRK